MVDEKSAEEKKTDEEKQTFEEDESYLAPDQRKNAIDNIKRKDKNKLKMTMKILRKNTEAKKMSKDDCLECINAFAAWLESEERESSFNIIAKAFYNWIERVDMSKKNRKL